MDLGGVLGPCRQGGQQGVEVAVAEFDAALLGPQGATGALGKRTLARSGEFLSGVEEIDDPDGMRELFLGEVSDPGGAIAEDDLAVGPGEAPTVHCAS